MISTGTKQAIKHFYELLSVVTKKELQTRYKHTILGFFWLILNPLAQMLVIGTVFTFFIKEPVKNYYYFLFLGLLSWNFFFLSITKATPCIVYERNLIKKAKFPKLIIPFSIILSNLFHFLAALLLFFIPLLFLNTLKIPNIFFLLPGLLLLISFTIGLSLFASALNVKFRDINFFMQTLLLIWFYATPILYSIPLVPKNLLWLWNFNPLTSVIQLIQYSLLDSLFPDISILISNVLIIIVVCILGFYLFQKESKNFVDWI